MSFTETHLVGQHGAPTWSAPDPTLAEGPRLDAHLPVQLLEARGDWWHVRCANGWEAWTDGRWIDHPSSTPTPTPTPAAAMAPTPYPSAAPAPYQQPGAAQPWYGQPGPGVGSTPRPPGPATVALQTDAGAITATVAAVAAGLSTILPWYQAGPFKADAWDIPWWGLVTNEPSDSGVKAGAIVILSAFAVVALFVRLPAWAYPLFALPALGTGLIALVRWVQEEAAVRGDLGIGLFLALLAGAAIAVAAFLPRRT